MDRRSSSPDPSGGASSHYKSRRDRGDHGGGGRSRRSRSRSRSSNINRNRSKDRGGARNRRSRTRSRSRDRNNSRRSPDLYRDLINQDYQEDRGERGGGGGGGFYRNRDRERDRERDRRRDRDYNNKNKDYSPNNNYLEEISNDSHDSESAENNYSTRVPNNKIIVRGLAHHFTEADICSDLIQYGLKAVSIRVIRKKKTGASRGFAFVEFNTEEEATRWMEYKQGVLILQDQFRAVMDYSTSYRSKTQETSKVYLFATDWFCGKCGIFNFKRRESCFKCYASREESEKGGEGSDEVSNILTKKIMLRNLDVLTNEEGVLTTMQEVIPTLVSKISKILICRDPPTSISRGICYLSFDNLVDSMNTHNALKGLEPPLTIDSREVLISYCVDSENRNLIKGQPVKPVGVGGGPSVGPSAVDAAYQSAYQYTLGDVRRLAEYSASLYASNTVEHEHYLKYYTQYYYTQISKGQYTNLPTLSQIGGDTANSGAAVAQSAIQRKMQQIAAQAQPNQQPQQQQQHQQPPQAQLAQTQPIQAPKGNDGKKYPTPDISLYQYDETSGYYYDPVTGLYYDANSQYYYNNETNSYLYWDNENSTYVLAPTSQTGASATSIAACINSSSSIANCQSLDVNSDSSQNANDLKRDDERKERKDNNKQDKVKVAKKIVKDMEKWAKQLNQKKDMMQMPVQISKPEEMTKSGSRSDNGYADVGFAILEKKEKVGKFGIELPQTTTTISKVPPTAASNSNSKLVPSYGSDSENDGDESRAPNASTMGSISTRDYVDFEKLTCLLCKRAFQSQDILNKHLKMSSLHLENLKKYNLTKEFMDIGEASTQSYRDRAKERRLKYGEDDSPPPNRCKERFQRELVKQQAAITAQSSIAAVPIGENNVGNRLLQKMGWSEGQGLGRSNQGRTNIIETESRAANAGLGSKSTSFAPGDDYKSYIKKMMKSRYDSVDIK